MCKYTFTHKQSIPHMSRQFDPADHIQCMLNSVLYTVNGLLLGQKFCPTVSALLLHTVSILLTGKSQAGCAYKLMSTHPHTHTERERTHSSNIKPCLDSRHWKACLSSQGETLQVSRVKLLTNITMNLPQLITYIKTIFFCIPSFHKFLCLNIQMMHYLIKHALICIHLKN